MESKAILKTIEEIKKEAEELYRSKDLYGSTRISKKATKKKTVKAIFPIRGKPHFNLFINDKIYGSFLFNGKEWKMG
jgi:hypothetical protein